jgi:hypothetical protein
MALGFKTGGRQAGTPNKKTEEWEAFGRAVIDGNLDRIQEYMQTLEGEKLLDSWLKVVEYFRPKQARTEIVDDSEKKLIIEIDRGESQSTFEESSPSAAGNIS